MKLIENLDEPAHMRPLEPVRQVHIHIDRGDGILAFLGLVEKSYRIGDGLYPDLLDIDPAMVSLVLNILHQGIPPAECLLP
jgi:hypothetical protein